MLGCSDARTDGCPSARIHGPRPHAVPISCLSGSLHSGVSRGCRSPTAKCRQPRGQASAPCPPPINIRPTSRTTPPARLIVRRASVPRPGTGPRGPVPHQPAPVPGPPSPVPSTRSQVTGHRPRVPVPSPPFGEHLSSTQRSARTPPNPTQSHPSAVCVFHRCTRARMRVRGCPNGPSDLPRLRILIRIGTVRAGIGAHVRPRIPYSYEDPYDYGESLYA